MPVYLMKYFKEDRLSNTGTSDNCCLPQHLFKELDKYIEQLNINLDDSRRNGFLIQILHKAQNLFGYLPEEIQLYISKKIKIPHAEISGVVSFYNYFTAKPKGRFKISICMGTACFVKGADKIQEEFERNLKIKVGELTDDGRFSIDVLRCIGACGLAPVVLVNEKVYGNVTVKQVGDIIAECVNEEAKREKDKK